MKNKVLKLAKRLGKFSVEDISQIITTDENQLEEILQELLFEKSILKRVDSTYFYQEKSKKKTSKLPLFFEFRTKEELDIIIKCFCAEVPVSKTALICSLSEGIIATFTQYFRKTIYEHQVQELNSHFIKKPQQFRLRNFYDKSAYFYFYSDNLYVSENALQSAKEYISFQLSEVKKFKILYSRIKRILNQNTRRILLHHHIAECLWRDSKSFDVLVDSLYQLLKY